MQTNIAEIIRFMPKRKLWSYILGDVEVVEITNDSYSLIKVRSIKTDSVITLTKEGYFVGGQETCILSPGENNQSWVNWAIDLVEIGDIVIMKDGTIVKVDPRNVNYNDIVRFASSKEYNDFNEAKRKIKEKLNKPKAPTHEFKPYDKVLATNGDRGEKWHCTLFSHRDEMSTPYIWNTIDGEWKYCIPFEGNEDKVGQIFVEKDYRKYNF